MFNSIVYLAPYYQPIYADDQPDDAYSPYYANAVVSDYTPVTPVVFDNGKIFAFAEVCGIL